MTIRARCQCGGLTLESDGPPDLSSICCCIDCQRRTGSVLGVSAYFPKSGVRTRGDERTWARDTATGRSLTNHFCPTCGTTLYWHFDMLPDHFGVAHGCLEDPVDPPARVVWTERAVDWLRFPDDWPTYPRGSEQRT